MSRKVVDLCEICSEKINGMAVVWRRGFTAVCCVSCAGELARMLRERRIRFEVKTAKDAASILIRSKKKRPSWEIVSERLLEERQPLWEALAV